MRFIVIPPEQIARARALYEGTAMPVHDIAAMLGLGVTTFLKRVKLWGWKPRNLRLAELDAAAKAQVDVAAIAEIAAPALETLKQVSLTQTVRAAVESQLRAIQSVLARVDAVQLRSPDVERAARSLSTLVRTLRDLALIEGEEQADETPRGDQFSDLDEFRLELARRLRELRSRSAAS
jgi:hypothetical protein